MQAHTYWLQTRPHELKFLFVLRVPRALEPFLQLHHPFALISVAIFRPIPVKLLAFAAAVADRLASTTLLAHVALQCSATPSTTVADTAQNDSHGADALNDHIGVMTTRQNEPKTFTRNQ